MRGASDVSTSSPCFTMKWNSPSCPCRKTTPFRCLCATQRAPLNMGSIASSICAREGIAHVGEGIQVRSCAIPCIVVRCASTAPSLLRPRKEAVPVWREVFIPPSQTVSRHCCEKTFQPRAQDVNNAGAQHSFLFVTLVDQGAVSIVCAAWWVKCSLRVYVTSSTPVPSSRRGPTDRYDGERAHSSVALPFALFLCSCHHPYSCPEARDEACPPGILVPFP